MTGSFKIVFNHIHSQRRYSALTSFKHLAMKKLICLLLLGFISGNLISQTLKDTLFFKNGSYDPGRNQNDQTGGNQF